MEHLVDSADEVHGAGLGFYGSRQDGLVGDIAAIVSGGVFGVLVDYVAGKVDAGKDPFVAGVGEEGGVCGLSG